ncbi:MULTISPECIES: hypothetical protein [Pseudoalteromonas]|uniref:hypothetical protein n=1 Tax=Pseudoalteromonas TaxID=53246 RepID=UPI0007829D84|nr:hypothetical protein [Pseudoalteromonas arabiensis]UJX27523.1 hypothetical protein L3Q70_19975 [Pseudoalteromonas sp. CF6-2]
MKHDVWVLVLAPGDKDYSDFCFDTGIIGTGWASVDGYHHVLAKSEQEIGQGYDLAYSGEDWADNDNRNKAIYALNKIANEIKTGDKVLIRKGNKKLLAVGEVTGDYKFKKNWVGRDLSHIRDVRYTAIAREQNLFDIMVKHLGKQFSMGHTIYYFGEIDHSVWGGFVEGCRDKLMETL